SSDLCSSDLRDSRQLHHDVPHHRDLPDRGAAGRSGAAEEIGAPRQSTEKAGVTISSRSLMVGDGPPMKRTPTRPFFCQTGAQSIGDLPCTDRRNMSTSP